MSLKRLSSFHADLAKKNMQKLLFLCLAIALASVTPTSIANSTSQTMIDKSILAGGKTTVFDQSEKAYSFPASNLSLLRREDFFMGKPFFKQPWVTAPASTKARDGLGALFNANSCQSCHVRNGRGRPPLQAKEALLSATVSLSIPKTDSATDKKTLERFGAIPDPIYGHQLQNKAILGIKNEATPSLTFEEIGGQFADGEKYSLLKPTLRLEQLNYGSLHDKVMTSIKVAPALIGLGLLDLIAEQDILAIVDPDDVDKDGISGKANRVWDVKKQKTVLGRFGWKAAQPSVAQQSAMAFSEDLGITSSYFPEKTCTSVQTDCLNALHGGEPEIPDTILQKVVFYTSMIAVPSRRDVNDVQVKQGEALFASANCIACHVPTWKTAKSDNYPELSQQTIQPYTDLLLHDMGEGLADNRPLFEANGQEWRTPPLWGIGLVQTVNKHSRFLHDGRARNLMEAVLWHGGEAEQSKQRVLRMSKEERQALVAFLRSL